MMKAAQTNLQLYAQLQASGWSDEHLALTARAYDLAVELVGARVRHSGKPFVAHFVGTASLAEQVGVSPLGVVVGLVHAIYSSGDWGIAKPGPSRAKRRRVREELGEEVEALLHRYEQTGDIPGCLTLIDSDDPIDRELLLLSLVNRLEDHIDDGMLHQVKRLRRREHYLRYADEITSVVERLEHPCLETAFRYEFERLRAAEPAPGIAAIYETKPGGNAVVALPSYRMRPAVWTLRTTRRGQRVLRRAGQRLRR